MTTIVLMRHGETAWNRESRLQGWAPVPLNDQGREQANSAAAYLNTDGITPDRVVSSDLMRTRETTTAVESTIDVSVQFDEAWRERDLGVYQGLPYETVADRFPAFGLGEAGAKAADRIPDSGESLAQVSERVVSGWQELLTASSPSETILVVTHGGPIRLLIGHIEGLSIAESVLHNRAENCSFTEIEYEDEAKIVRKNTTPWAE
ncbi:histidine phosphatase family protein [Halocatena marina]|uniref:Histidine phosphatase family protein n=1 Tax=Halocatena marina TaxID=2934937 RepID=A0ABD5YUM5_9EURY|nr:histidine phosphatase family protein [Halocatena marina]